MEYSQQLNELKGLILSKCGIRYITPADCKRISIDISRELNKNVSETTIKRLFGFAAVRHKFSNFTLTTLADFVDMVKLEEMLIPEAEKCALEFKNLREKSDKITQFTLKTIQNRSGIPYQYTVKRGYAEEDFQEFVQSDKIFTSLISQPGYGKTILLSHLTESLFYAEQAPFRNSTILFFKAYHFFTKELSSLHIEELLQVHLQLTDKTNVLDYINKAHEINGSKFILVIDGFSDLPVQKDDLLIIFDNLINLICSLEDYRNIKLVVSMRSTTWTRFYNRIRQSAFLVSKWFPGKYYNAQELSNVPQLSEKEINSIIKKMNDSQEGTISTALKTQLRYPFQIQLYYQLKEQDPEFNYYINITFFELVAQFIKEKIYHASYYTEKLLFLKRIIRLADFGKSSRSVEKDKLFSELSFFRNAYTELVADGILMEEKSIDESHPKEYVRFLHLHTFEYFLFVEILEKFNLQLNQELFDFIQREYEDSNVRFQLLQWTARFLIITNNFTGLRHLLDMSLVSYELNYLLLFIAEEIKFRSRSDSGLLEALEKHNFHRYVISKLNNFDFIDSYYQEAVSALMQITQKQEYLLTYNAVLGIMDLGRLDKAAIAERINLIKMYDDSGWMFNPADVLQASLDILNGTEPHNARLLRQIEGLKDGKNPFSMPSGQILDTQTSLGYAYLLFLNMLTGDPAAGAKIIEEIFKLHPDNHKNIAASSNYLMVLYWLFSAQSNPESGKVIDKGGELLEKLLKKGNLKLSKFQEGIISMFKAQQAYRKKDYLRVLSYSADGLSLFSRNEMMLNPIIIYNLLIKVYSDMNNPEKVEEFKMQKMALIAKCEIDQSVFSNF